MWLLSLLLISVVFIVLTTTRYKWHPVLSLITAAFGFGLFSGTMTPEQIVKSVNSGFGNTLGLIGIVILAGSIIGKFLEKSGGAFTLAESTLKIVGKKNVPLALSLIGYIVSIPVFCDSGFIILSPLAKAITKQAKISYATGAMALSLGLILTHSIIPPTPGPLGAAGIIGADLGLVIAMAFPVSIIGLIAGWLFSVKIASHIKIDPSPEQENIKLKSTERPSAAKSLLPIFVPILLIIFKSVNEFPSTPLGTGVISTIISFSGQPVVALIIGILLSFMLPKNFSREMLSAGGWIGEAVIAAATIIIITGCGGAFGTVLQNSGIGEVIKNNLSGAENLSFLLPIVIAASLKTAQGSGTVAIVTGASIMVPLLGPLGMEAPLAKALVVVALGAGGMIASHANDSYFWVVTQMSDMKVNQGYKLQTLGTMTVGIFTSISVWLLSLIVL